MSFDIFSLDGYAPSSIEGRHCLKRMSHDMFADCDLGPLCLAHSFSITPLLLSEHVQRGKYHVRIRSLSNRRASSTQ